ncbi:malonate decarboxylase subunit epsilon [Pectobacteriaceae bacterium CE90]|nr:malonate decarboxylase subunit epsilon [Pectobacteriaceae bacterium CE90]
MKILFTFPGQGAQVAGMLHQLPDNMASRQLLVQASDALSENVLALDSASALHHTRAVQLCLLIAGVAYATELDMSGVAPDIVSGLSIGAFPAAVISGALDFSDAVRLVALRGELMECAYPQGYGLTAISGLLQPQMERLLAEEYSVASPVYLANINAEDQMVIAGSDAAMQRVIQRARDAGAHKAQRLAVSVPSHCALLDEAAQQLSDALQKVKVQRPRVAYLSGSNGRVYWQPEQISRDLALNMARTVHWHDAMIAASERGVQLAIEMPPGSVLTGLTRRALVQGEAISRCQLGVKAVTEIVGRYRRYAR